MIKIMNFLNLNKKVQEQQPVAHPSNEPVLDAKKNKQEHVNFLYEKRKELENISEKISQRELLDSKDLDNLFEFGDKQGIEFLIESDFLDKVREGSIIIRNTEFKKIFGPLVKLVGQYNKSTPKENEAYELARLFYSLENEIKKSGELICTTTNWRYYVEKGNSSFDPKGTPKKFKVVVVHNSGTGGPTRNNVEEEIQQNYTGFGSGSAESQLKYALSVLDIKITLEENNINYKQTIRKGLND